MAHRAFRKGAQAIGKARTTTWIAIAPIATTLSSSTATVLVATLNAAADALRPFTIVRTYIEYFLTSDQVAASEEQACSFGMAIVSDQASAIGVTAVPTPTTDLASDLWYLHKFIFGDELSKVDETRAGKFGTIDSKAMRKVDIGQDVILVAEGAGVGSGMILTMAGRFLVKNN